MLVKNVQLDRRSRCEQKKESEKGGQLLVKLVRSQYWWNYSFLLHKNELR